MPLAAPTQPQEVLRLGTVLLPLRLPVELNGRVLQGYQARDGRYPVSLAATLDEIRQRWLDAHVPLDAPDPNEPGVVGVARSVVALRDGDPDDLRDGLDALAAALGALDARQTRVRAVDTEAYITALLLALVPGLEAWEADALDPAARMQLLHSLGYLSEDAADEAAEPVDPPPAPRSTGRERARDLPVSTG